MSDPRDETGRWVIFSVWSSESWVEWITFKVLVGGSWKEKPVEASQPKITQEMQHYEHLNFIDKSDSNVEPAIIHMH